MGNPPPTPPADSSGAAPTPHSAGGSAPPVPAPAQPAPKPVEPAPSPPSAAAPSPPEPAVPAPALPPAEAAAPSPAAPEMLYQGSVSFWLGARSFALAGIAFLTGTALLVFSYWKATTGWPHQVLVVAGSALALASLLMTFLLVLSLRAFRYTITTRYLQREMGLFVKRVDNLDLLRVKDVQLRQGLLDRILGLGSIEVYSSDRTDPMLQMEGVRNPRPVYEKLRDAVLRLSERRGLVTTGD